MPIPFSVPNLAQVVFGWRGTKAIRGPTCIPHRFRVLGVRSHYLLRSGLRCIFPWAEGWKEAGTTLRAGGDSAASGSRGMLAVTAPLQVQMAAFQQELGKGSSLLNTGFWLEVGDSFLGDFWEHCLPRWGEMFLGQAEEQDPLLDTPQILLLSVTPPVLPSGSYLDSISHLPMLQPNSLLSIFCTTAQGICLI